ncbi:hypothetical protein ACFPVX_05615 [Cohnella faecalis]|uniref:Uncharacterized protein n=1 Tax=Cohnella faecalis TaxID=2315694 RepID=A0A398CBR8_9BACL|nr:hypothetical protein [Cohnella faecalis]RIE00223.1 hypothetical protein D3H35_29760 [Cohnella faecalis]
MSDPNMLVLNTRMIQNQALENGKKATTDYRDLTMRYKLLFGMLKQLIEIPVAKKILDFHKIHFQYLLIVVTAVENMKPFDDAIEQIQRNLDEYVRQTGLVLAAVRDIPQDPWEGMNKMGLIVLAPALKESPELARTYNDTLDAYEKLTQEALNAATLCADQGRAIEADTRLKAVEILAKLDALKAQGAIDVVLIEAARKKVQFIQLDTMTRIQTTRGNAEDGVKRLQPMVLKAAQAQRID